MSRKVVVNPSSINMVRTELVKLVKDATANFEALQGSGSEAAGVDCLGRLEQIAGIYRLLELNDAALLADELRILLQEPGGNGGQSDNLMVDLAVRAFSILANYPDYLGARRTAVPALLLDDINALRGLRKQPALPESLFVSDTLSGECRCPGDSLRLQTDEDRDLVRRLRHIYQVGLLGVLKGRTDPVHLRLMARACNRMEGLAGGGAACEFWWLLMGVLEGFASGDLVQNPARNRLLANADRQFRASLQSSEELPTTPEVIRRELIYVAGKSSRGARARQIREAYELEGQVFSDTQLGEERDALFGPCGDTIQSMVDALKAELERGKGLLEQAAQQESSIPPGEVVEGLMRVASVLKGAGMRSSAQTLEDQVDLLNRWAAGQGDFGSGKLLQVADAILYVETTLDGLRRSRKAGDLFALQQDAPGSQVNQGVLGEAQEVVLKEASQSLESVKRAVNAYVEGGYDVSALGGCGETMRAVAGSLGILNQSEAAHVLDLGARTVDFVSGDKGDGLDSAAVAEGFADVLVCIEYFIGALGHEEAPDSSILTMAEESLKAIYAPVAQAS